VICLARELFAARSSNPLADQVRCSLSDITKAQQEQRAIVTFERERLGHPRTQPPPGRVVPRE